MTIPKAIVRQAVPDDALSLYPHLHEIDLIECLAMGSSPKEGLLRPFLEGQTMRTETAEGLGGTILAMWGVMPFNVNVAAVWLLSRPEIYHHRTQAVRYARQYLDRMNQQWPLLIAYCYDHPDRIRMLDLLGFDIKPEIVHIRDVAFRQIARRRQRPRTSASTG